MGRYLALRLLLLLSIVRHVRMQASLVLLPLIVGLGNANMVTTAGCPVHFEDEDSSSPEDRCPNYQASSSGFEGDVQVDGHNTTRLLTNGSDTTNVTIFGNGTVRVLFEYRPRSGQTSLLPDTSYRIFTYVGVFRENGTILSEYFQQCNVLTLRDNKANASLPDFDTPGRYFLQMGHDIIDNDKCIRTTAFWIQSLPLPPPTAEGNSPVTSSTLNSRSPAIPTPTTRSPVTSSTSTTQNSSCTTSRAASGLTVGVPVHLGLMLVALLLVCIL